ncbi:MAG: hypothetical protein ACOCZV_00485 [Nanoarchaeota archaeon]
MNPRLKNALVTLSFLPAMILPKESYAQFWKNWGKDEPTPQEIIANDLSQDHASFQATRTLDSDDFFNGMNKYFIPEDELPNDSTQRYIAGKGTHFNGDMQNIAYARTTVQDQTYHAFAVNQEVLSAFKERLGSFVEEVDFKRSGNILNQIRVLNRGQLGQYDESLSVMPDSSRVKGDGNGPSGLVKKLKEDYDQFTVLDIDRPSEQDTSGIASYVRNNSQASFIGHFGTVAVEQSPDTVAIRASSKNSGNLLVIPDDELCAAPEVFQKMALGLYELEDENTRLRHANDSLKRVAPEQLREKIDSLETQLDKSYARFEGVVNDTLQRRSESSDDGVPAHNEKARADSVDVWKDYVDFLSGKRMELQDSIASLHNTIDSLTASYDGQSESSSQERVSLKEYRSMVTKYEQKVEKLYDELEAMRNQRHPSRKDTSQYKKFESTPRQNTYSGESAIQESMNRRYNIDQE